MIFAKRKSNPDMLRRLVRRIKASFKHSSQRTNSVETFPKETP